jgi:hypothetical protein
MRDGLSDAGLGEFAVAAGGGGQVDKDGAGAHGVDCVAADEARGGASRDLGGGDDDVRVGGGFGDKIAAAVEGLFSEFGRVAATAFSGDAAKVDVKEFCAEGADLLACRGADVVGLNDCAEAAGGCDGLEAGYSCSDDEDPRGRNGAGGGHEHGEKPGEAVGGHDDGFIAGDGGHGGERIHGLGAGDAGDELHAEEGGAVLDGGDEGGRGVEGLEEADNDGARLEARLVGGVEGVDGGEEVGGGEDGVAIAGDGGAGFDVGLVGSACGDPSSGFHGDINTLGAQ